ncbi:MAG: DUF2235 domain-containing protein [Betaproteobacteria bacterium]
MVLCFDGTWNTDRSNTNVSRLFRKIADNQNGCGAQRRFYDEGVGTKWGERFRGGVLGMGLDRNIRDGYAWLATQYPLAAEMNVDAQNFVQGPNIYLFGFSRGAFTARSLGGLINCVGIPRLETMPNPKPDAPLRDHPVIQKAWDLYAKRPMPTDRKKFNENSADAALRKQIADYDNSIDLFRKNNAIYPVRIHFIGVWDTVGALGIPRVLDWIPRPSNQYVFHDTRLGGNVRFAYHAAAIDEHRAPYSVALWTDKQKTTEDVEQRWFPGAHADVGGGYDDDLLPDPPLAWIAQKAADKGLHFVNDRGLVDEQTGAVLSSVARPPAAFDLDGKEYLSPVHDSYAEFAGGTYRMVRGLPGAGGRVYRRMLVEADGIDQTLDASAQKKMDCDPSYRPPNLSQAGRVDVSFTISTLDLSPQAA